MKPRTSGRPSPFTAAGLNFLELSAATAQLPEMDDFRSEEKALFEEMVRAWAKDQRSTVSDAIFIEKWGPRSKLRKQSTGFHAMEMVDAVCAQSDIRTQYLVSSMKGMRYLDRAWQGMQHKPSVMRQATQGCRCARSDE